MKLAPSSVLSISVLQMSIGWNKVQHKCGLIYNNGSHGLKNKIQTKTMSRLQHPDEKWRNGEMNGLWKHKLRGISYCKMKMSWWYMYVKIKYLLWGICYSLWYIFFLLFFKVRYHWNIWNNIQHGNLLNRQFEGLAYMCKNNMLGYIRTFFYPL